MSIIRIGDELPKEIVVSRENVLPAEYVLCCGTIEVRKNHGVLYRAWKLLYRKWGEKLPALVLVGHPGWYTADLVALMQRDPETKNKIIILKQVLDTELPYLYERCLFTVYPSYYEGWGLPIAESLAYGKFCLSSNTSSMQEIAPKLVDFFNPENSFELAEKLDHYFTNREELKRKEQKVRDEYQLTSWKQTAQDVLRIVSSL